MAGGLFVFVRTAPPGGCALAITAGQYRPHMAHGPLSETLGGPFLFYCHPGLVPASPYTVPLADAIPDFMLFTFFYLYGRRSGTC